MAFSLKHKLFILLLAISIIPILLSSTFWQQIMFRSSTEHSTEVTNQYVQFLTKELTKYLHETNDSLNAVITDADFQAYLNLPKGAIQEQARLSLEFRDTIRSSVKFSDEVVGLLLLTNTGSVLFESYKNFLNYNYNFESDSLYRNLPAVNTPILSPPHKTGYLLGAQEEVFSFIRPVVNLQSGRVTAWLIVDIKQSFILDMLNPQRNQPDPFVALYHQPSDSLVAGRFAAPSILPDLRSALQSSPERNDMIFPSAKEQYQIVSVPIPFGNWSLLMVMPLTGISEGLARSIRWSMIIAFASLAAAVTVSFPIMSHVLKPLYKLKTGISRLAKGTYMPIEGDFPNDEFGFLVQSYNRMLNELKTMQHEVYQANMREKERELLQLQAQINPHFLFNTLEAVELFAAKGDRHSVNEIIQNLSRMMRYSVKSDDGWVPLKEELKYVQYFLNNHRYRHGSDADVSIALDPRTLELPVMKLSIQPFVENAIKYGLQANHADFQIHLSSEYSPKEMRVVIHNTGAPVPPAVMEKLQRLIASKGQSDDPFFRQHTGIQNVCRRFYLAYGNADGIRIESDSAQGTKVTLTMRR